MAPTSAWRNDDIPFWLRVVNPRDTPLTSLRVRAVGGDVSVEMVCSPGLEPPCTTGDSTMTPLAPDEKRATREERLIRSGALRPPAGPRLDQRLRDAARREGFTLLPLDL